MALFSVIVVLSLVEASAMLYSAVDLNLTAIPEVSQDVTELDLQINLIVNVDIGRLNLANLVSLVLKKNDIASIPKGAFANTQLERLDLSNNELTDFPDLTGIQLTLKYLYLSGNKISVLSASQLKNLKKLQKFYVVMNGLTELPSPEESFFVSQFKALSFGNRNFEDVPNLMSFRSVLLYLKIVNFEVKNKLGYYTNVEIQESLKYFESRSLGIDIFPNLTKSQKSLKRISFTHNELADLQPELLNDFSALMSLDVSNNKLTSFPTIHGVKIEYLSIADNFIYNFPDVSQFSEWLTYLDLSGNNLTAIKHSDVVALEALVELLLDKNQLPFVSDLRFLPSLQLVSLTKNPLHCSCEYAWLFSSTSLKVVLSSSPCSTPVALQSVAKQMIDVSLLCTSSETEAQTFQYQHTTAMQITTEQRDTDAETDTPTHQYTTTIEITSEQPETVIPTHQETTGIQTTSNQPETVIPTHQETTGIQTTSKQPEPDATIQQETTTIQTNGQQETDTTIQQQTITIQLTSEQPETDTPIHQDITTTEATFEQETYTPRHQDATTIQMTSKYTETVTPTQQDTTVMTSEHPFAAQMIQNLTSQPPSPEHMAFVSSIYTPNNSHVSVSHITLYITSPKPEEIPRRTFSKNLRYRASMPRVPNMKGYAPVEAPYAMIIGICGLIIVLTEAGIIVSLDIFPEVEKYLEKRHKEQQNTVWFTDI